MYLSLMQYSGTPLKKVLAYVPLDNFRNELGHFVSASRHTRMPVFKAHKTKEIDILTRDDVVALDDLDAGYETNIDDRIQFWIAKRNGRQSNRRVRYRQSTDCLTLEFMEMSKELLKIHRLQHRVEIILPTVKVSEPEPIIIERPKQSNAPVVVEKEYEESGPPSIKSADSEEIILPPQVDSGGQKKFISVALRLFTATQTVYGGRGSWRPSGQNFLQQLRIDGEELTDLTKSTARSQFGDNVGISTLKPKSKQKLYESVQTEWLEKKQLPSDSSIEANMDILSIGNSLDDIVPIILQKHKLLFSGDKSSRKKNIEKAIWMSDDV
jgi:hypothetical protein